METLRDHRFVPGDNEAQADLMANNSDEDTGENETDLREWNVYARLRIDGDELSYDGNIEQNLYWFVGYGRSPEDATYIKCLTEFEPDGRIPIEVYHTEADSPLSLYHAMPADYIRPLYALDCTYMNFTVDSIAKMIDPPSLWNLRAFDVKPSQKEKVVAGNRYYTNTSVRDAYQRMDIVDPTQHIMQAQSFLGERMKLASGLSNNMLGEINGGRTPATEGMSINMFATQAQFAWASYLTKHWFADAGQRFARYWEVYGDQKVIKAVAGEQLDASAVGELYGEFDIMPSVVDEYVNNFIKANQVFQLITMFSNNPAIANKVRFEQLVKQYMQMIEIPNASKMIIEVNGDDSLRQREEIDYMQRTMQFVPISAFDDDEAHIAELDAELERYAPYTELSTDAEGRPAERDGTTERYIEILQLHRKNHADALNQKQGGGQQQQAPAQRQQPQTPAQSVAEPIAGEIGGAFPQG
jgi:hypothetical protein